MKETIECNECRTLNLEIENQGKQGALGYCHNCDVAVSIRFINFYAGHNLHTLFKEHILRSQNNDN